MAQIFPEGAGMDKAEDPVQMPDGTLRCLTHHLETCGKCCVDYSFMREVLAENAYDEEQRQLKRAKRKDTASSRLSDAKKCIDGCAALEGNTKRCSGCKVSWTLSVHASCSKCIHVTGQILLLRSTSTSRLSYAQSSLQTARPATAPLC